MCPPELPWERVSAIIRKGTESDVDSYSGFRNNWNAAGARPPTGLVGYLRERGVRDVIICGLTRDFCVKWSAEDAVADGFRTIVLWDLTRGPWTPGPTRGYGRTSRPQEWRSSRPSAGRSDFPTDNGFMPGGSNRWRMLRHGESYAWTVNAETGEPMYPGAHIHVYTPGATNALVGADLERRQTVAMRVESEGGPRRR